MSKSEVLYVKGMQNSDTDDDDQWDDKKLNAAYDKAVRVANIEVAKRVAMSTNTPCPPKAAAEPGQLKKERKSGKSSIKKDQNINGKGSYAMMFDETPKEGMWRSGMPCRLVFCEDGLEYEAVIAKLVGNDDCIVKYLGYDNQELVAIDSLMPSLGKEARTRQIMEARAGQVQEDSPNMDNMDTEQGNSDRMPSPDSNGMDMPRSTELTDRTSQKKKKSKKKKNPANNFNNHMNGFEFPEMPPMPNLSMLTTHLGSSEMPMPMPPPPMAFATSPDRTDSEDQAISSMLLSWYMSGYYTGLYQGMKRAKEGRRN